MKTYQITSPDGSTYPASEQQCAVFDWVEHGAGSAFIEAVAGAGKTTTLIEALRLMDGQVAFAAYNKKIADEIKARIEPLGLGNRVRAGTFHSFGNSAWFRAHGKVKCDDKLKRDRMILECKLPEAWSACTVKLTSLARQAGAGLYFQLDDESRLFDLVDHHDLTSQLEEPDDIEFVVQATKRCLKWSRDLCRELIDFDDMIWLPVITNVKVWQHNWVLVDEAQDTNPIRRALARKMLLPRGRAGFVGDRHQAIYGFTGADSDAVDLIMRDFNCRSLPLTVTYRCPKSVAAEARRYVAHIEAHESAPRGEVTELGRDEFLVSVRDLTARDVILCRNTKPLVSLAFHLIRRGVGCHVEGKDIGAGLKKLALRWKVKSVAQLRDRLETFRDREVEKLTAKGEETRAESIADRVETLLIVMDGCDTVKCVTDKIDAMFQDTPEGQPSRTLTLSTVHKAKGREWPRVFILGFNRYMPSPWARQAWQQEQEINLIYVAITRSQDKLVLLPALED